MQDSRRVLRQISLTWGALSALGLLLAPAPARAATLSAEAAADFDIEHYVEGLADPTDVAVLPDGRLVVIQKLGDIVVQPPAGGAPVDNHIDVVTNNNEQGLLGVVADPGFANNQFIYFYASSPTADASDRHQVLRYKLGADSMLSDMTPVVTMGLRGPANHNGGGIDIYQGNMYIGVGDTGANSPTPQNHFGSCLNIANGKVLRVSLAEATLGQPPADNPLVNETMVTGCTSTGGDNGAFTMEAPEKRIFAWGFRNPFRLWVDRTNGKVWVGDVGEETREEISIVEKGKHYGYPFEEGTEVYNQSFKPANGCAGILPGAQPPSECIKPVYDWDRGGGGTSIGGRILDGCGWPAAWTSRYIFGDHEQGQAWTIQVNATRDGAVANSVQDFATTSGIAAFRMGTDNALYLVERGAGRVERVTAKNSTTTPGSCPTANPETDANPGGGGAGGGANGGAGNPGGGNASAGTGNGGAPGAGTANMGTAGITAGTATSTAGTNGASGGGSGDSGGCGCRTAGGAAGSLLGGSLLAGALALALQRRRRSRRF